MINKANLKYLELKETNPQITYEISSSRAPYVDYDRIEQIFYDNIYFEDSSFVLKLPLISLIKQISHNEIKIEKFDLAKYAYLLHHK